jgi:small GTP-binding protein
MEEYDYSFKIVIVGDSGVGKSGIFSRFSRNYFDVDSKATLGVEFFSKTIKMGTKTIKAQVWDTAGQERFRALAKNYYRGSTGVMLVYDTTNFESFRNLERWLQEVKDNAEKGYVGLLIGNKCDLIDQRAVKKEEALSFAQSNGLIFMESSARKDMNIKEAFDKILTQIFENFEKTNKEDSIEKTRLSAGTQLVEPTRTEKKKAGCNC